jgi:type IV pilus assembly protein PilC
MPKFLYTAKNQLGTVSTGTQEATDAISLAQILKNQNLELITAKPQSSMSFNIEIRLGNKVSLVEKLMFTRNLQVMIASGVPAPRALDILSQQTKNKYFAEILNKIAGDIVKGEKFSDALKKHPKIFPDIFCSMIALGEESGTMDKVLKDLEFQMEKEHSLKSKVKGAMMYPSIIVFAMLLIGTLIMIFVVPQLKETFTSLGAELPATTKVVLNLGDTLSSPIFLLEFFGGLFLAVFLIRKINSTIWGKRFFDSIFLKMPVIGQLIRKYNVANIIGTLSTLLATGLPIVKSLDIISKTTGNIFFKESLVDALNQIQKGSKLSDILVKYKDLYSLTVVQMISIGEETGETSEILKKMSEFYQEEVVRSAESISTIIEPVLMLIVGGCVAFFAAAMFSPIYSMMGAIQ